MLYLICTPIGNLNDFSIRSINTLKQVDRIYSEDTRVTSRLLKHFDINKKSSSFHEHNEAHLTKEITELLIAGESIAIMSDAGAPLISDPGFPLSKSCIDLKIAFTVLPGPSSVINAVLLSGLPLNQFTFYGFLPKQNSAKKEIATQLQASGIPHVFFESVKRLVKTIDLFKEVLNPATQIAICREMTKEYESVYRGSLEEISILLENSEIKLLGEIVIVIHAPKNSQDHFQLDEKFCRSFLEFLSPSDASKLIAKITKLSKQEIYRHLLAISKSV